MARNVTLTQLIADVRLWADIRTTTPASDHITDVEITRLLNLKLAELHEMLVTARGADYSGALTESTIALTAGTSSYPLPATIMQLASVELTYSTSDRVELVALSSNAEIVHWRSRTWARGESPAYRMVGANISIFPTPTESVTLTLRYVPAFQDLVNGSDTYDGVNGWEKLVTLGVAREILVLQNRDFSRVSQLLEEQRDRVETMASERQASDPLEIRSV